MPKDPLGNEIEANQLVILELNGHPMLARVAQVLPGGVIGSSADRLPVPGQIVFQVIIPMVYQGDEVKGVWVVRIPSNQELAMAREVAGSETPS